MQVHVKTVCLTCVLHICVVSAATDVVLTGKVLQPSGLPIEGVRVSLMHHPYLAATTNTAGRFDLRGDFGAPIRQPHRGMRQNNAVRIGNGRLFFTTSAADRSVTAALFTIRGQKFCSAEFTCSAPGNHSVALGIGDASRGLHVARVRFESDEYVLRNLLVETRRRFTATAMVKPCPGPGLARSATAEVDTLVFEAGGYWPSLAGIQSYLQHDISETLSTADESVYIAGHTADSTGFYPCYWHNGSRTDLKETVGDTSYCLNADGPVCIHVSGNVIGAATSYDPRSDLYEKDYVRACYWKNDKFTDLGPGRVNDLVVEGQDIYTCGTWRTFIRDPNMTASGGYDSTIACYWKNAVRFGLMGGDTGRTEAHGICVSEGDVYVVGFYQEMKSGQPDPVSRPCCWKNGERTTLGVSEGKAYSVCVSDGDLYISAVLHDPGKYGGDALGYWKNESFHAVIDGNSSPESDQSFELLTFPYTLHVCKNRVGISGTVFNGEYLAYYWLDGVGANLGFGLGGSIYLTETDVHVAVHAARWGEADASKAYYIRNDERIMLGTGGAHDLFVVQR